MHVRLWSADGVCEDLSSSWYCAATVDIHSSKDIQDNISVTFVSLALPSYCCIARSRYHNKPTARTIDGYASLLNLDLRRNT